MPQDEEVSVPLDNEDIVPLSPADGEDAVPLSPADDEDAAPLSPADDEDLAPLSLADEEDASGPVSGRSSTKIQAFGAHASADAQQQQYNRTPSLTGTGAIRCRLFHAKLTVGALDHMVNTINEWLDGSEIEAKYIAQVVGTLEGKTPEPNVIVTVWY